MQVSDKKLLRKELIQLRKSIPSEIKRERDIEICTRLFALPEIAAAEMIFCYVSTPIEVDTRDFIARCLSDGKRVLVPRCDGDNMEFCEIKSLSELRRGMYNIDEPTGMAYSGETDKAVCIVPALRYDKEKYRLGYGKGYYDRFLAGFDGISVGLCYEDFIGNFPRSELDLPTDILITEQTER